MQRLDKILSSAGAGTRKELRAAIRAGRVAVNGSVCRDESAKFDETNAQILLDGEPVELLRPALMLSACCCDFILNCVMRDSSPNCV